MNLAAAWSADTHFYAGWFKTLFHQRLWNWQPAKADTDPHSLAVFVARCREGRFRALAVKRTGVRILFAGYPEVSEHRLRIAKASLSEAELVYKSI